MTAEEFEQKLDAIWDMVADIAATSYWPIYIQRRSVKITPLFDKILVRRIEEKPSPDALIVQPDSAKDISTMCEVLAVGPGKFDDAGNLVKMTIAVGDTILLGRYSGTELELDGGKCLMLKQDEALGIVTERD